MKKTAFALAVIVGCFWSALGTGCASGPTVDELETHAQDLDAVRDGIACVSTLSAAGRANLLTTATNEAAAAHSMARLAGGK